MATVEIAATTPRGKKLKLPSRSQDVAASMKPPATVGNALHGPNRAFPAHIVAFWLAHIDIGAAPPLIASQAKYIPKFLME